MTKSFVCKIKEKITTRLKTSIHTTKLELKLTELALSQKTTIQTNDIRQKATIQTNDIVTR